MKTFPPVKKEIIENLPLASRKSRRYENFIVQAYDNAIGWLDTKHQSNDYFIALRLEENLRKDKNSWITGNPTNTRIAKSYFFTL
jgi:hypothetical protein